MKLFRTALVATAALTLFTASAIAQENGKKKLETGVAVGKKIPEFKAQVEVAGSDKPQAFNSIGRSSPTVYVFMSQTCPYCAQYVGRLASLSKDKAFADKVDFVMVYPNTKTTVESKRAYHAKAKFSAIFLNDPKAAIAKKLEIKKTPEILLASKTGEIVFRGGIDDNPFKEDKVKKTFLKNAITEHLAGKAVSVTSSPLFG